MNDPQTTPMTKQATSPPDFVHTIGQAEAKQFAWLEAQLNKAGEELRELLNLSKEQPLTEVELLKTGLTSQGILQRVSWRLPSVEVGGKLDKLSKLRQVKPLVIMAEWLNNPSSGASMLVNSSLSKNIAEELAFEWFKTQMEILGGRAELLPKRGKRSLYLTTEGRVVGYNEVKLHPNHSRSIDFMGRVDGKTIYVTAKYTQGKGGTQDNQGIETEHFLTLASRNNDPWAHFLALVDGAYFQQVKKQDGKNWIERQREIWQATPRLNIANSTSKLVDYLTKIKQASLVEENPQQQGKDSLDWQGAQEDKFDQHSKYFSW